MKKACQNAFTLIELLVVLVVISILVAITIPVAKYVSYRAREAQYDVQMAKIKNALEDYRAKYGEYPITPTYEYQAVVGNTTNAVVTTNGFADVARHYPGNLKTECAYNTATGAPQAYTTFILTNLGGKIVSISQNPPIYVTNYLHEIIGEINKVKVDYALSYPLVLAPLERGEEPYVELPLFTVLYQATDKEYRTDYERTKVFRSGNSFLSRTTHGRYGWPINRTVFLDPRNNRQIKYTSDGLNYSITNWSNM